MSNTLKQVIAWAKRDNICAAALFLGVVGSFPHALDALSLFINNALIPLVQAATGGK